MFCNKCGAEIDINTKFCNKCGSQIFNNTQNNQTIPNYIVLQVVLKEAFAGVGSRNLAELENIINNQASKGYRLHTMSTTSSGSTGPFGGDRIQATMVFEKL